MIASIFSVRVREEGTNVFIALRNDIYLDLPSAACRALRIINIKAFLQVYWFFPPSLSLSVETESCELQPKLELTLRHGDIL